MAKIQLLTKSRFKIGAECPTKLYYNDRKEYGNKKSQDDFLKALAEGGFQVGELAKLYFPGGVDVDTLNKEAAIEKTNELLKQENVTIFEAAIAFDNLLVRVDVLEKKGDQVNLIEVKAKSFDSSTVFECFDKRALKKGEYKLKSDWGPYVLDVAFQTFVFKKAYPLLRVTPHLMLADKSKSASLDGIHQLFLIERDASGRTRARVSNQTTGRELGRELLVKIPLSHEVENVLNRVKLDWAGDFNALVAMLSGLLKDDKQYPPTVGAHCKGCEFRIDHGRFDADVKSGFTNCWKQARKLSDEDFKKEFIFDVWNFRGSEDAIEAGTLFIAQLTKEDIDVKPRTDDKSGLSRSERQWVQVESVKSANDVVTFDHAGLSAEIETYEYPLHFIDFETATVAIPFHKGRRPYEQLAYQFSHHVLHKNGKLEHRTEYLDIRQNVFPNFDFGRALKKALEGDKGTVFRFAAHENTVLNQIRGQLMASLEPDRDVLVTWIESLTTSSKDSDEQWTPTRQFVDMLDLTLRFYFLPETRGSNSIKKVLPAVLGYKGKELESKFPQWIQFDEIGRAKDPYKLLPPIFSDLDQAQLDLIENLLIEKEDLNDGGAAIIAWSRMQFTEMSDLERQRVSEALLRYCALDTLAMVMIWEWWMLEMGAR
ncbi:MAG: DUF2779 domain-containing protein [Deltaproteobacteria bacterium]|nr:DUF2779 domain-containing protein [Deltaproteobacteria bacterium]